MDVFTVGYEGYDQQTFQDLLAERGVEVLVDLRERAFSRNRAFSKKNLAQATSANGIEYRHIPELGGPKAFRDELRETGDFRRYAARYRRHLASQDDALDQLYDLITSRTCCLLCMEHDHKRCHRSMVAAALTKMNGDEIDIHHL